MRMPHSRAVVEPSSPRQGAWVVDVTEGDGEDDSGEDQTYEFLDPIDTDEQFENVVDALQHDMEGVEVLVDVPGPKGSATSPPTERA